MAFCRHLTTDQRLELFERRRAEIQARIAERRRGPERTLDRYLRTLRERDDATLSTDLAWLDRLIADERRAATEETHS